jgi:hypothetical protein
MVQSKDFRYHTLDTEFFDWATPEAYAKAEECYEQVS